MCGIAGFFTADIQKSEERYLSDLDKMTRTLSHRGPDAQGGWHDAAQGVYLGHRRLSILDLSDAGAQPMVSHCGRYVLSYNGEIYNTALLLGELQKKDGSIVLRGHSDTEILLECFARLGLEATLSLAKGMFAIALWDQRERVLHLIRDHMGKKPLYVGWVGGCFAFASELKALEALAGDRLEIDFEAFRAYRYFGFVPAPRSIYKNIHKLPAAHWVTVSANDVKERQPDLILAKARRYWQVAKSGVQLDKEVWEPLLKEALSNAVAQRMMSDVPLGAFLSGGVDSSLVTALMQEQSKSKVKTYSIGFEDTVHDESKHAEKVARHLGTEHTRYIVTPRDSLDVIPKLADIYDEPFADYSQIPSVVLCQQAKKDTTVALSGDGGDEVFCGYKRYFMLKKLLDASAPIPAPLRKILAGVLRVPSQQLYNQLRLNGKRIYSIAGFLGESDFRSAVLRTLAMSPNSEACPGDLILGQEEGLSDLERMMMIDTHLYLPDDILVKVDRASMFSSLEIRSPLLDKDVVELAWRMPIEDKVFAGQGFAAQGRGKKPLYDLLCTYVPREIIDRPKQGFTPPIAMWLKGELKDWAESLIHTRTPLFDSGEIILLWDEFISGKAAHQDELWNILMAQFWYVSRR